MGRDDYPTAPADCLTLVMPLQARAGMSSRDFYEYWLNAHVTLAGVRGVAVADVIRRLGASSQLDDEVSALFLPGPAHVLV